MINGGFGTAFLILLPYTIFSSRRKGKVKNVVRVVNSIRGIDKMLTSNLFSASSRNQCVTDALLKGCASWK